MTVFGDPDKLATAIFLESCPPTIRDEPLLGSLLYAAVLGVIILIVGIL